LFDIEVASALPSVRSLDFLIECFLGDKPETSLELQAKAQDESFTMDVDVNSLENCLAAMREMV
jgi:hypothetical protein